MAQKQPPSPEFIQAMTEYEAIVAKYGMDSKEEKLQFHKLLTLAPQQAKDEIAQLAKEMGLIPKPSGYADDGQPLFNLMDIQKHFGLSDDEMNETTQEMESLGLLTPHTGNINRIQ
jgi:hypothetical protein